mmetsp:Transcript_9359/g.14458  ORF Transcript_9359/g.14458 Transcript_9359/m.14458 type:complete len:389 (-) Transcript_9359:2010-3176(-)
MKHFLVAAVVFEMSIFVRAFVHPARCRIPHALQIVGCRSDWALFSSAADGEEKKRVVFLGTPDVAAQSLRDIYEVSKRDDSAYEIVSVITQPPKRRKRKGKVIPSPVGLAAEEIGIPVLSPEKAKDPDFLEDLETNVRPDLCITAAYGQYLPKRFLATPTYGTVNIHPSILPRWRGASPVQRSLEAGDNPVGVSVLFTVSKMDAGPIIAQEEKEIDECDQATDILPLLFDIGTKTLIEVLPKILDGSITMETAEAQDESLVKEASMIDPSEAELRIWEESALVCHNRVRGFSMWPGTFIYVQLDDEEPMKVKITQTRVLAERTEPTKEINKGPAKKDGLRLICSDGSVLEILRLQPATRKEMDANSFINGLQGRKCCWIQSPVKEVVS